MVITRPLAPKPTKEGYDEPSLESPRLKLRAIAITTDMFRDIGRWRKMSSLRDSLISGFEPQVSNRSFGAIFEHANRLL